MLTGSARTAATRSAEPVHHAPRIRAAIPEAVSALHTASSRAARTVPAKNEPIAASPSPAPTIHRRLPTDGAGSNASEIFVTSHGSPATRTSAPSLPCEKAQSVTPDNPYVPPATTEATRSPVMLRATR